ncbi:hypothetical protein GW17_00038851 [Ensete ventricosum]|nr:hypothetical protein GW17_00038851 [Ensete ventricosum]RZR89189.1 hypothetical protein BHM03_00016868 [Ensete ventricosum]
MEKMLRQCVIGHELCHEKPLVILRTASNEVHQPLMPHLSHPRSFRLQEDPKEVLIENNLSAIPINLTLQLKQGDQDPTTNCWASGHDCLENLLTATSRPPSSFPRYTTLGAFSPLSETIRSGLKPFVAALSSASPYSLKAGT